MSLFRFASCIFSQLKGCRRRQDHRKDFCLPEILERRAMLTGNNTPVDNPAGVDFNEPPPIVSEVGAGLETFASADAYADWLVGQAVERWHHLLGQPSYGLDLWWDQPYLRDGIQPLEGDMVAFANTIRVPSLDLALLEGAAEVAVRPLQARS